MNRTAVKAYSDSNELAGVYLRILKELANKGIETEEDRLKAFYHLAKYMTLKPENSEEAESNFYITTIGDELLKGVSIEKFIQYFPIEKTYDGTRLEMKDYFSTVEALKEHGLVIKDPFTFLWDYHNRLIRFYVVARMGFMSRIHEQSTGKSLIEDFFGIAPMYLKEINGKEVLYDSKTGKTKPVRRHKRRPKWIRRVK